MNKLMIRIFTLAVCLLLPVHGSYAGLFGTKISTTITYEVVDSKLQPISPLPQAYQQSLLSLEAGLRGVKKSKIQKSLGIDLIGEDINVMQETLKNLKVINVLLDNIPASGDQSAPVSGYMTFSDDVGRSLQIGFVLLTSASRVTVISLKPIFYGAPNIEVFVVPEKLLDASTSSAERNYSALYKNISSKSLKPGSFPAGNDKYVVAAFFKSLIPPGVIVGLKLDREKEGLQGDTTNNKYQIFEDGWIVAVSSIQTNLLTNPMWAKITLKPDSKLFDKSDEYLVGLYSIGGM